MEHPYGRLGANVANRKPGFSPTLQTLVKDNHTGNNYEIRRHR